MTTTNPTRTIVVVGAGSANLKSTVVANLVAAIAALDVAVALRDDGGTSSSALAMGNPDVHSIRLPWCASPIDIVQAGGLPTSAVLVVVDPSPRLDEATRDAIARADLVLVPVDASALGRGVLREVAAIVAEGRGGRLRVVLSRVLPRTADRWALVDDVATDAPGALLHATLPMVRARHGPAGSARGPVTLYAPGTAAARAYGRVARELLAELGCPPALNSA